MSRARPPSFVLALILLAAPAYGDPSNAARAFAAGITAYGAGDYATAIAAFEEAFRVDSRPEVAFTLAQAHRNQYFVDHDIAHLQRALGLYRHYLAEAPEGRRAAHARLHLETIETILASLPPPAASPPSAPPPTQLLISAELPGGTASVDGDGAAPLPRLVEVTAGTHRIRVAGPGYDPVTVDALAVPERLVVVPVGVHPQPARLVVHADPGAELEIDGRPTHDRDIALAPGEHRLALTLRGHHSVARTIELSPGESRIVELSLAPTLQRRAARITGYSAAALGGLALAAGGMALRAQRDATSIPSPPGRTTEDLDRYHDALARRDDWRRASVGLGIAAGALAGTALALWWFDTEPAEHQAVVAPVLGPETVGAAVVGRF